MTTDLVLQLLHADVADGVTVADVAAASACDVAGVHVWVDSCIVVRVSFDLRLV